LEERRDSEASGTAVTKALEYKIFLEAREMASEHILSIVKMNGMSIFLLVISKRALLSE